MTRRALCWSASVALTVGLITSASARPQYLQAFKAHYDTANGKPTLNAARCGLCHIGNPGQGKWNAYGEAVRQALGAENVQDRAKIDAALDAAGRREVGETTFAALIDQDRAPGAAVAAQGGAEARGVWYPLFTGVDLSNLTPMNQGHWEVHNYLLRYTGGGNGWLRTNNQYTDYSLMVRWRYTEPGSNNDSGIFLRAGIEGNPWPNSPQLNMGPGENIGSVSGTQGTRNRYDLIHPNDWNIFQITVYHGQATLAINGQVAWEGAATGISNSPGYIGVECEGRPFEIDQLWVMQH